MRLALALALAASPTAAAELPTPLAERIATIAALDKRSGEVVTGNVRPGGALTFGPLTIRLAACETTAPWEAIPETGAFVQIDEARSRARTGGRVFSGWLFAGSPGLSAFEHPDYDVWVRACAMRFPETGPDTIAASSPPARSNAKKSPRTVTADDNSAR